MVRFWSFFGLYFPALGLNTEKYGVSLNIQSEYRKIRTRKSQNTDTSHAVLIVDKNMFKVKLKTPE